MSDPLWFRELQVREAHTKGLPCPLCEGTGSTLHTDLDSKTGVGESSPCYFCHGKARISIKVYRRWLLNKTRV